jgi:glycine betaine/choline ABC-type transport system substrate-binding protein
MNPDVPDYSRSRAILIGTTTYQDSAFLPLPAAANSLRGLREILADPRLCRWPADRITVLPDPTDVRRLVTNVRRWARDTDDVLLVYFVGHGTITPRGELCLALSDTEFDESDVTGIEYDRIRAALLDSPARIKVVILDCCYSGRAIQALSPSEDIADITDIRGVYTITSSDHAAHVPPLDQQAEACTSFTGELLDLIRTGIPGGPDTLTLNMIYSRLRTRLRRLGLPAPNQRGTDTVGEFGFTRNAALLPEPIQRFPRPETPPSPVRPAWRRRIVAAAGAGVLVAVAVLTAARLDGHGAQAAHIRTVSQAKFSVVVGSGNVPEQTLIAEIYAQALMAKGILVTRKFDIGPRSVYFPAMQIDQVAVIPEYNGTLLTTSLDPKSKAVTTQGIDAALTKELPPSMEILDPAPAQDKDSVTVAQGTAAKYHLTSITDLIHVATSMIIGGPPEFESRQQGLVGLRAKYGLTFRSFRPLDDSGPVSHTGLTTGYVQAADIFTTDPAIQEDHLVTLADPDHVFTAGNVVPLVYKNRVNAMVVATLNAVSARLTQDALLELDVKVLGEHQDQAAVVRAWLKQVGLS